jgi:hypothetical protein
MSGVVVGQSEDAAFHFFTDGGVFNSKGELIATAQKTHMLGHHPAALTILGPRVFSAMLYAYAATCATFDYLLDTAVWALRGYHDLIEKSAKQDGSSADFQIFTAGYSHRLNRLAAFVLASNTASGVKEPFVLQELSETTINPPPSHLALDSVGWNYPEVFDVRYDGLKLVQAQRQTPMPFGDGSIGCVIGGFIQHTTITRDQVRTRIVHRWPDDKLGERIVA